MKRFAILLLACLLPHLALAQSLGYGIAFGLSPNNLSNTAKGTGYAATDTITLSCTQPSTYGPYVAFLTSPVITVGTVSSGAISTWYLSTQGSTNGTFSNSSLVCTQASTTGSGTGATFSGQLVPNIPANLYTSSYSSAASLPAISSCGTVTPSVTAGSNSNAGQFVMGSTGSPTACTITFAVPYATNAYCSVTPAIAAAAAISGGYYISAQSKTAFTLTVGTAGTALTFNYTCSGN